MKQTIERPDFKAFQKAYEDWRYLTADAKCTPQVPYHPLIQSVQTMIPDHPSLLVGSLDVIWGDDQPALRGCITRDSFAEDWGELGRSRHIGDLSLWLASRSSGTLASIVWGTGTDGRSQAEALLFLRQAYRVLCPGGLLIVETNNPDWVGSFDLGMETQGAIDPDMMEFALYDQGFGKVAMFDRFAVSVKNKCLGPLQNKSARYCAIAQKPGPKRLKTGFQRALNDFDSPVTDMANVAGSSAKQSSQLDAQSQLIQALGDLQVSQETSAARQIALTSTRARTTQLKRQLEALADTQTHLQAQLNDIHAQHLAAQGQIAELSRTLHQRNVQIEAFYKSTSWRLTRPFRLVSRLLKSPTALAKDVVQRLDQASINKPRLRTGLMRLARWLGVTRNQFGLDVPTLGVAAYPEDGIWAIVPPYEALNDWETTLKRHATLSSEKSSR